jgi:hypothetical protein
MLSDFWSSLWQKFWSSSRWVRLLLIVASVAALASISILVASSHPEWGSIAIVILIGLTIIGWLMKNIGDGFGAVRTLLNEHASRSKERLANLTKDLKDHSAGDLRAIEELYRLQEFHIRAASRNLAFALVLLLVSIGIVVAAGYFIDNDAPKIFSVEQIKNDITDSERDAIRIEDNIISILKLRQLGDKDNDELKGFVKRQQDSADHIKKLRDSYIESLNELRKVDSLRVDSTHRAVSLLIFRISVLAVSIFTVILLVRTYRSNTIMGNVFRGRMIALLASDQEIESLTLRVAALSAEHVDFGGEPKHPIDYMLSAIREIGKALRPSSPRSSSRDKTPKSQPEVPARQGSTPLAEAKAGDSKGSEATRTHAA